MPFTHKIYRFNDGIHKLVCKNEDVSTVAITAGNPNYQQREIDSVS